jgi:hypothetical protein
MNDYKLTDHQQAILLLIRCGKDTELNPKWIKQIESLEKLGLTQIKPNTKNEWMLTIKGEECMAREILIKYPLHNNGEVASFNKVVRSMDESAIDALVCSMINEGCFEKVPEKTARVLGQHFLNTHFYKKWGSVLIEKWHNQCVSSLQFFSALGKKYGDKTESNQLNTE